MTGDSRREKWKQEKIRDAEGERLNVQGAAFWRKKDDKRRARRVRSRVCKTENEAGGGKKEERVSGWFIESLSGAVDLCAEEGAGGGAFI